ncbi:hypothetical protein WEB32_11125 [Streptomyces netropsis]|uniref:hypothetical protein n=1 Tax=Streptomyces netropsis TaxID=55404 RepID=UPI0030CCC615
MKEPTPTEASAPAGRRADRPTGPTGSGTSDSAGAGDSDCPGASDCPGDADLARAGGLARAGDSARAGDDFGLEDFSGPAQLLKLISAQLATQLAGLSPTGPAPHGPAPSG